MATRSTIGIKNVDGSITNIYCHWDGYPEYVGTILNEFYKDNDKIKSLIELGDLSSLAAEVGEQHPFDRDYDKPELDLYENWCMAYGRDRGETGVEAKTHPNLEKWIDFREGSWCEYAYLWDGQSWLVHQIGNNTKDEYGSFIFDFVEQKVVDNAVN